MVQVPTPKELKVWINEFSEGVQYNLTAQKAWAEIERAGLAISARALLYWYAHGTQAIDDFRKRNRDIDDCTKAAQRARRVAAEHRNDSRAGMFAQRAADKVEKAAISPWINPCAKEKTLADAVRSRPEMKGSVRPTAKIGESVRRFGTKPLLLVLRDYAASGGVRLGYKRLAALANCAKPADELSPETLAKFFKLPAVIAAAKPWLAVAQPRLKSPKPI